MDVLRGDLTDPDAVEQACTGCDVVFHVAAKAGIWGHYTEYYEANVRGTGHILAACAAHGVGRLVYTSSPSVVFDGRSMAGVDESVPYPRRHHSHYAATKALGEQAVLAAVAREVDVQRDLERVTGPLDILDHAAPWLGSGGKLGIDATAKMAGEEGPRGLARPMAPAREAVAQGVELIAGRAGIVEVALPVASGRVVLVSVKKQDAGGGAAAIAVAAAALSPGMDFIIAVDACVDVNDSSAVFFDLCANFDPSRDLHELGQRIGLDGTSKTAGDARNGKPVRPWPPRQLLD